MNDSTCTCMNSDASNINAYELLRSTAIKAKRCDFKNDGTLYANCSTHVLVPERPELPFILPEGVVLQSSRSEEGAFLGKYMKVPG